MEPHKSGNESMQAETMHVSKRPHLSPSIDNEHNIPMVSIFEIISFFRVLF